MEYKLSHLVTKLTAVCCFVCVCINKFVSHESGMLTGVCVCDFHVVCFCSCVSVSGFVCLRLWIFVSEDSEAALCVCLCAIWACCLLVWANIPSERMNVAGDSYQASNYWKNVHCLLCVYVFIKVKLYQCTKIVCACTDFCFVLFSEMCVCISVFKCLFIYVWWTSSPHSMLAHRGCG